MDEILRKLRGLLGVGVTWGAVWAVVGSVVGVVYGLVAPDLWQWGNPILDWTLGMGMYGFVSGVGFGKLLALAEGRRRLDELSLPRVAMWGVLGSAAVPLLFAAAGLFSVTTTWVDVVSAMGLTALLGGLSAPGAIALARRAELSEGESRDLLSAGLADD